MKLLFDQNISFRLVNKVADTFPEARQVRHLGLEDAADSSIWAYAKQHDYTIVTFDADFLDIAQLKGVPPKIIWLRTGNMTTDSVAAILTYHHDIIRDFIISDAYQHQACLEID